MKIIDFQRIIQNKYIHLMAILLLFLITLPVVSREEKSFKYSLVSIITLFAVLMALRTVVKKKSWFILCSAMAAIAFMFDFLPQILFPARENAVLILSILSLLIFMIFLLISIVVMIINMFRTLEVSIDTIFGGISIYLLLGIMWACIYILIIKIEPGAFTEVNKVGFFYFSFTTLTTLGYGDIVPVDDWAMVFANLEAVTGQIYLTVFVARLVGLHIAVELRRSAD